MGEIRNNKSSHELDDGKLEIISGGRTSEVKFYNVTKGICECIVEIDNGRVVDLKYPTSDDNSIVVTKKHLDTLVKRGLITNEQCTLTKRKLDLYSSLTWIFR